MCNGIYVTIRPLNREDSVLYFPPESFGPFRVLHQIGAGTLGPVFRAYEQAGKTRDRLVAVKVFRLDLTPEQTTALVGELNALIAADLSHPHVAAPIAAGLEHGAAYLAQEYAVGDSLDVVLRERGRMSIEEGVALVESLASAIDDAAARGVHHGSLHLRDILVTAEGPRITGFGITAALTKIGAKRPTRPQYSSPDGPSDVYSLGAIAFESVSGKRVSADNLADFEQQHGIELRGAFSVALAANPDMRPERAGDFAAVLRDAAEMTAEAERNTAAVAATSVFDATDVDDAKDVEDADDDGRFDLPINPPIERASPLLTGPIDDEIDRLVAVKLPPVELPPAVSPGWSAEPPRMLQADLPVESTSRRWPLVAMLLVFAALAALSVAFFLRSPVPAATEPENAVDETTVELPGSTPAAPGSPPPAASKAARTPEPAPSPSPPAPAPSRAASGAVRRAPAGNLLIRTTPPDADVLVNGQSRGKTPLVLRDLALGSYTIRVAREGYAPAERTLQLTTRRPTFSTTINLRSTAPPARAAAPAAALNAPGKSGPGGLNVQSRPPGAQVFVNDRPAGSTPVAIPGVPAGDATVRIEMNGYQPWSATVRVNAGEQTRVAASLETK